LRIRKEKKGVSCPEILSLEIKRINFGKFKKRRRESFQGTH